MRIVGVLGSLHNRSGCGCYGVRDGLSRRLCAVTGERLGCVHRAAYAGLVQETFPESFHRIEPAARPHIGWAFV